MPAHFGRLLAYAIADGRATPRQRGLIATALRWRSLPAKARGSALALRALGQVHNPSGVGFARRAVWHADRQDRARYSAGARLIAG
jgi:hypothetical protein